MVSLIRLFILILLSIITVLIFFSNLAKRRRDSLARKLERKSNLLQSLNQRSSDKLVLNPEHDIKTYKSDQEMELREKVDIHKARLSKFGKSKLDGKVYYKGPKGGVFLIGRDGKKRYV